MRIKTRIQLGIVLSVVLAATIALLLFVGARAVNEASRLGGITAEVVKGVSELKIVTHEYLLHPEERSLMQWRSKYGSLSKLLTGGHFKSPDEKILADQVFKDLERFKTVFFDLTTGLRKGEALGQQESSAFRELQDRLMGDLLVKSQAAISLAFQLHQEIEAKSVTTQKRVSLLTVLLLLAVTAAIVGILLWVNRSVARPIAKLEKDTRIIGSGNLDHKVGIRAKDEIGELSRAFDMMTGDLKKTTASIVELNKEIDERKQAEEAVRESEERYRSLIETITDIVFIISPNGNLTYLNPEFEKLTGYPVQDVIGHAFTEVLAPEYIESAVDRFTRGLSGETIPIYEVELKQKDGKTAPVELKMTSLLDDDGKTVGRIGLARDISERKRAEEALRESEKKYRELVDFLPIPLFETDVQGNVLTGNRAIFEAFGYTQDDLEKGLNIFHMTSTEDRGRIRANIQRLLSGEKKGGTEYTGIRKDGSIFPEIMFSSPILRENKPVGLRGAIIDLTAQKQTEASLQKITLSLAEAQRIAHIGNWEWDIKSDEMYWSDEIYRIVGATHQTFGRTYESFSELIYADDRETVSKAVQKAMNEGAKSEFKHRIVRFDGSICEIRQRMEPILDDTGRAVRVIGIVEDLTEKNQADRELQNARDQLLQSEKLASMGRLSAGVAHEILNPVNIISMELQILQTMETLSPKIREELEICMDQISRIVTIAENLKQFSRIPEKERTLVMADINDVIGHVLTLYSTQLKIEGVETELQYQSDLPEISIERERIEQVIANLISNAMFFMEGRDHKVLRITTKREVLMGGHDQLRIVIADTGAGIKSEHMSEIFDPFFTTKEQGKGTGLGLSISYSIIEDHGGKIWAENNEWGGASFYIELPEKPNISPVPEKNR